MVWSLFIKTGYPKKSSPRNGAFFMRNLMQLATKFRILSNYLFFVGV